MQNKTISADVIKNPHFETELKAILAENEQAKKAAEEDARKKHGLLKASPLYNLMRDGKLTPEFVKAEFPKIANKESQLSSSQRQVISLLVFAAAERAVAKQQREHARKVAEKANAKLADPEEPKQPATPAKPKGSKRKAKKLAKKA